MILLFQTHRNPPNIKLLKTISSWDSTKYIQNTSVCSSQRKIQRNINLSNIFKHITYHSEIYMKIIMLQPKIKKLAWN